MNQDVSPITPRRDRRGRPIQSEHPFPRAVEASGSSVQEWAKRKNLNIKTVRAWYSADKEAGRRIPRAYADLIEREFKDGPIQVPATLATWVHGIR